MRFSYIDKSNIAEAYGESKTYMKVLHEPLDEYERLARNRPHPSIAPHLPKVTEGTLSSTIIKQPRRIIQQIPTGKVESPEDDGLAPVLDVVLTNQIIPHAITNGNVLQKSWDSTTKALTYGSQPTLIFYTQHGDYMGVDWRHPYIKHVSLEKGQLCSGDAKVQFLDSWWTPNMLKSTIQVEKYLMKRAKDRGEEYKPSWDMKMLDDLTTKVESKEDADKTPAEKERNLDATGVHLITAFQEGVGGEFYTMAPALDNGIARTKENKDPRGMIPIEWQFHTVDGGSPLGRGAPEQNGAVQNLLDSQLQGFQYASILRNAPPLMKWGDLANSTFKVRPDAIWNMGADINKNKVEAFPVAPQADFVQNFQSLKSILITGSNGVDTSISSESGNVGFSRTQAGVKHQEATLGVDDNYIRKQYESYIGRVFETAMNLQIAESAGKRELVVSGNELDKLAVVYPEIKENGGRLNVIYDKITSAVSFTVDASTSAGEDNENQVEILDAITDRVVNNPNLLALLEQDGFKFSVGEAVNRSIVKSGVQDPEKIIRKMSDEEIKQKQMTEQAAIAQQQGGMQGGEMPPIADGDQDAEGVQEGSMQDADMQQPQQDPNMMPQEQNPTLGDDPLNLSTLASQGLSSTDIADVLEVLHSGGTVDDALKHLKIGVAQ